MSDNGDKKLKKWGWLAHVATIIASVAALLTALNGSTKADKQDKVTGHFYNTLSLEVLPKLHERVAVLEVTCKPRELEMMMSDIPTHKPECNTDEDCPDFTACVNERCTDIPPAAANDDDDDDDDDGIKIIVKPIRRLDKPQKKFDDFKLPAYDEFKMQAQHTQPMMPSEVQ